VIALDEIGSVFEEFPNARREHLIPILQAVQGRLGFLARESMIEIGARLRLPVSKVYGVATFYNQFRFEPRGKVHCQVCRGTACHVKGSVKVLEAVRHALQVEPGRTTRDGAFSLEVVACIGACGLAPVVTINDQFYAGQTSESVRKLLKNAAKTEAKT
jgi:NADH-quinone oxidoreductase subunit E